MKDITPRIVEYVTGRCHAPARDAKLGNYIVKSINANRILGRPENTWSCRCRLFANRAHVSVAAEYTTPRGGVTVFVCLRRHFLRFEKRPVHAGFKVAEN